MTIIAARQFENKWALFTDDCVTMWQSQVSAAKRYRPKLREISWKNYNLVIASCWWTREIDVVLNLLQAKLEIDKVKDTIWLGYVIQTTLIEAWKVLWEIAKDPSVWLLILETNSNTLRHSDDYSLFQLQDEAEIVAGSWEQAFLSAVKYKSFWWALRLAVMTDEYCEFPIYAYRDEEVFSFYPYQDENEMEQILMKGELCREPSPVEVANAPRREPSGLTGTVSIKLW